MTRNCIWMGVFSQICVLAELGLTPAEIAALKGSGALVQDEQQTKAPAAG